MPRRIAYNPNMILPPGTQVVTRIVVKALPGSTGAAAARAPDSTVAPNRHPGHPVGTVGEIIQSPADHQHAYRVRFADGREAALRRAQFAVLRHVQRDRIWPAESVLDEFDLLNWVIFRCVVGSRAYGLDEDDSDVDRRGIYLPPADMHWSLFGVPEQLENPRSEECYWELQKFLVLALKANRTCSSASIRRWSSTRRRWPASCSRCAARFCRSWSTRRTTAMS